MTVQHELEALIDGLLFPSESDRPMHIVTWPRNLLLTPENLLRERGYAPDTPIETRDLVRLFRPAITLYPGDEASPKAESAPRFEALLRFLQANLHELRVLAVGTISIDVYMLGTTGDGEITGLVTTLIDT